MRKWPTTTSSTRTALVLSIQGSRRRCEAGDASSREGVAVGIPPP
ncbi:hypothetical protein [Nocardioides malaquae]|nr:hypothetical protein [Nocardioides malaquae]